MDVKTAFVNGELEEEIYMQQSEGFILKGQENKVKEGMARAPTETQKSYVFIIDLRSKELYDDEIKVDVEDYWTLVISYGETMIDDFGIHFPYPVETKFDLPPNANLDAISAVSHNGTIIVCVDKLMYDSSTRSRYVKVIKTEIRLID
ncbi:17.1 kDa class II heat shock protein-like [Papaver somniferum]|uniref:17.1 kDa class II heat shock protein-like n=1 Tax=Papaver somniferum TaxID=3469 RepID=UPI000E6FC1B8|nr:17.1 kDa class II heat shock protein-like [Papaver somniferum]